MRTRVRFVAGLALAASVLAAAPAYSQQAIDQTSSLAGLCKVWGLLKYHHPDVADMPSGGATDTTTWDGTLVRVIPRFRAAGTVRLFNEEIVNVIREVGLSYVFRELSTDIPPTAAELGAAFAWIDDGIFEPATRTALKAVVLAHRPGPNAYVAAAGAQNPDFSKDIAYASLSTAIPSEEVRLVALFRFWNMVRYYCPGNDIMDRDWDVVLTDLIPRFRAATTAEAYHLAVAEMTASINDAHASTSSAVLSSYWGLRFAPLRLRLVEGRTVVTRVYSELAGAATDIRVGDVVTHIDGTATEERRAAIAKWVNGSNDASLERNIHNNLGRTNAQQMRLTVDRGALAPLELVVDTLTSDAYYAAQTYWENRNQVLWTILPGNIGYVHMGLLTRSDVAFVMGQLKNTRGLILDIRNYPQSTLYDVSNYLNPTTRPFAKFLEPDYDHPGTFVWSETFVTGPGSPNSWYTLPTPPFTYAGRVVVLANQETLSQAEYTVMAFQTAPRVTVIGSQTAGADGNVSLIRLPGGIATYFSGLGVFYPDGRPTQRVGIVPDIEVRPTILGLRSGADEVLEAAAQFLRSANGEVPGTRAGGDPAARQLRGRPWR